MTVSLKIPTQNIPTHYPIPIPGTPPDFVLSDLNPFFMLLILHGFVTSCKRTLSKYTCNCK